MGNASLFRRNEEEEEAGDEEYMEYVRGSPKAYPSALLFTPQVYVTPSERLDVNQIQCNEPTQNASSICLETMTPTVITWIHAGNHVAVEGSWDNWTTREFLQRSGREHAVMKLLPSGVYHYRFIVDGQWRCSPDLPQECDDMGNIFNILNLRDHKQEIHDNVLECEISRLTSYNNPSLNIEDFSEKVPELPPLLQRTPLDQPPSSSDNLMSLEKPVPAVLNHFYMHQPPSGESMVALSSTQRFRKKYVTAVIYKSLKKLKE